MLFNVFTEASLLEEPGAGNPHAGICAGYVGKLACLLRYAAKTRIILPGLVIA